MGSLSCLLMLSVYLWGHFVHFAITTDLAAVLKGRLPH